MEEKILNVLRKVLENENMDTTVSRTNCEKWDSLNHLNIISELEDVFGVEFEPEEMAVIFDYTSIAELLSKK